MKYMKKFEDMRRPELAEKNNDEYQNDKSLLAADHHSNLLPAYIHIYTSFEKLGVGSIDECNGDTDIDVEWHRVRRSFKKHKILAFTIMMVVITGSCGDCDLFWHRRKTIIYGGHEKPNRQMIT